MLLSLPYLFAGVLVGLVLSAIVSPPSRKVPQAPTPNDRNVYKLDTGCIHVKATEVPCTAETDSLNLLASEYK